MAKEPYGHARRRVWGKTLLPEQKDLLGSQRSPSLSWTEWAVTAPKKWQDRRVRGPGLWQQSSTLEGPMWAETTGFFSEPGNWGGEGLLPAPEKAKKWGHRKAGEMHRRVRFPTTRWHGGSDRDKTSTNCLFLTHGILRSERYTGYQKWREPSGSSNGSDHLPRHALRKGYLLSCATVYQHLS